MKPFSFSSTPRTFFGEGTLGRIFDILEQETAPKKLLLLTGGNSFVQSEHYGVLKDGFSKAGLEVTEARVTHEPSPQLVDKIAAQGRDAGAGWVVAIGGGSVLDAGKAVSAMIMADGSVTDYLEGVGTKQHNGQKVPFIAVPTTAGTGSEATKNAVLSQIGENGFKKSLRHDNFIPDYAILDPVLGINCPMQVTAASGMDALNQLMEGYMSVKGSPLTDALALSGIEMVFSSLEKLCLEEPENKDLRGKMACAAYLSGIVLANAGLGYVHGFAGVIGGLMDIPHGVVCGKLNAVLFEEVACQVMQEPQSEAYQKLLRLSQVVAPHELNPGAKVDALVKRLHAMEEALGLPSLSSYGADEALIKKAVHMTSPKESPVRIDADKLYGLIRRKL